MKPLLTIITLSIAISVSANTNSFETSKVAKKVEGYSGVTHDAPINCTYSVKKEIYDGVEEIVVRLNSDEMSNINAAAARIKLSQIPLKKGIIVSKKGYEVTYDGSTLSVLKDKSDGFFNKDYNLAKFEVSADLKSIKKGYVENVTAGFMSRIPVGTMTCSF